MTHNGIEIKEFPHWRPLDPTEVPIPGDRWVWIGNPEENHRFVLLDPRYLPRTDTHCTLGLRECLVTMPWFNVFGSMGGDTQWLYRRRSSQWSLVSNPACTLRPFDVVAALDCLINEALALYNEVPGGRYFFCAPSGYGCGRYSVRNIDASYPGYHVWRMLDVPVIDQADIKRLDQVVVRRMKRSLSSPSFSNPLPLP